MGIEDRLTELEGAVKDHAHMHETIKMLERVQALEKQVANLESRLVDSEPEEVPDEAVVCELPKKDVEINCQPPCPECFVCNGHNPSCSRGVEPKRWWVNAYKGRFGIQYGDLLASREEADSYEGHRIATIELIDASAYDRLKAELAEVKSLASYQVAASWRDKFLALEAEDVRAWDEFPDGEKYISCDDYYRLKAELAEARKVAETLRVERDNARAGVDRLRDQNNVLYKHNNGDFWIWQDDGGNHLESLCSEAVVMIRAGQLRDLLATTKSAYDRLRAIYDELTNDLHSVFSGSNPILPEFSPAGRDVGEETIRLAKEYKCLQVERDVLREFVEAVASKQIGELMAWDESHGVPAASSWQSSARRAIELADAARRGDSRD